MGSSRRCKVQLGSVIILWVSPLRLRETSHLYVLRTGYYGLRFPLARVSDQRLVVLLTRKNIAEIEAVAEKDFVLKS